MAALTLGLGVVAMMLVANRSRILEALAGANLETELMPSAEIVYRRPRGNAEIQWRKAA